MVVIFICHKKTYLSWKTPLFVWQPTVTAFIWVIFMATDSDGYHMDIILQKVLYHFSLSKVIAQKTKFNIEYDKPATKKVHRFVKKN